MHDNTKHQHVVNQAFQRHDDVVEFIRHRLVVIPFGDYERGVLREIEDALYEEARERRNR